MRENRTYGSEGGEGKPFPTPIAIVAAVIGGLRLSPNPPYVAKVPPNRPKNRSWGTP
jgi:hypothetical protein